MTNYGFEPHYRRPAVRAIESLLADPDRARAMGARGRCEVGGTFTTERQAARLAALMREGL